MERAALESSDPPAADSSHRVVADPEGAMSGRRMKTGEVAERIGLGLRTIRFYEEHGW